MENEQTQGTQIERLQKSLEQMKTERNHFEFMANVSFDKTFNYYQSQASRTSNYDFGNIMHRLEENPYLIQLLNGATGVSGESGEISDHIKKVVFHGHELDVEYLAKEIGDVLWYLSNIASALNLHLSDIANWNIEKLKKRYPNGFDEQRSINRSE